MITCGVGALVITGVDVVVAAAVVVGLDRVTLSMVSTDVYKVLPSFDFEAAVFILMAENRNN